MSGNYMVQSAGCPGITVNATRTAYMPTLEGWWGFVQTSNPAKLYRTYALAWSGAVYTFHNPPSPLQTSTWIGNSVNYPGFESTFTPDSTETITPPGSSSPFQLMAIVLNNQLQAPPSAPGANPIDPTTTQYNPFTFSWTPTSETVLTYSTGNQSSTGPGGTATVTAGTIVCTMSNPDTDVAAVARAIAGGGIDVSVSESPDSSGNMPDDKCGCEWDVRTGTSTIDFNYITCDYTVSFANLFPGVPYTANVKISKRTASYDGSVVTYGAWVLDSTNILSFTPSGTTYTSASFNIPNVSGYEYSILQVLFSYTCP